MLEATTLENATLATSALGREQNPQALSEPVDFYNFTLEELATFLEQHLGLPKYRATQIFHWVYREGVTDFSKMSNLAKPLREALAPLFVFPEAKIISRQISQDGTRKYLFEVGNQTQVEAVMIKQPNRMTLCVSSQRGCGMGCAFCRTATMGFGRHLKTSEILQQVRGVINDAKNFDDMFQNIVFMGMGEPLHNFDGVTRALKILKDPNAFEIAPRKITISSVGLVPAIKRYGLTGIDANLAISLNATTDEVRSRIMPVNKAFPLEKLLQCLREFPLKPRRKITIEYVMLSGVNDTDDDLKRLPQLLRGIAVKVNLIPYNENAGLSFKGVPFKAPPRDLIYRWQDALIKKGIDTTVRWSKGADISAACGQLAVSDVVEVSADASSKALAIVAEV